ncbi:hypothetical protein BU14_0200s0025 [Porphyra umbilicalis]|uniref:Uncharacterized protein n=1 Tax=Porphyra umbilicalis TaxID=2786 RepID=A0A1X6P6A9_PORUM|nr:hypothetical protein BU14_0200s0025 [Porphyra umbilicalis]|eukprot:OSX76270.1 hypothetical protein BU14_0200s0025 [Porphyra umbilicalis]
MRVFGRHLHHCDRTEWVVLLTIGLQFSSHGLGPADRAQHSTILTTPSPASISLTLNCGRAMGLVWSGCYCSLPSLPFHFRASPVLALSLPTPPPTGSDRSDGEACGLRGGCFGWEGHNDRRRCRTLEAGGLRHGG